MSERTPIIGRSATLLRALDHLSALAPVERPVLVLGERGTGKELAAERLHFLSARWESPYLKVNCAAMAESLLESELFGHEAGAFTGATQLRRGCFERADGGTLFLDELATTSPRLQEKLLRLVEYGEFERLGGQRTLQVDVRLIGATHADLPALAARGEFRHDLLDRLSFDVVHLPPLRERPEDILELAEHFATRMGAELGWPLFPGFGERALQQLQQWHWPGNVRELKNTVERSVHRWADSEQPIDHIVLDPFRPPWQGDPGTDAGSTGDGHPTARSAAHTTTAADTGTGTGTGTGTAITASALAASGGSLKQQLAATERQLLERALERHGYQQKHTASALGLRYDQLRGLMRKHGLRTRAARSGATPPGSDQEA